MNLVIQSTEPLSADHHKTLVALARGSHAAVIDANAIRIADANVAQRADLEVYCSTHQLDYAFVEPGRQLRDFGLVAMDMDSTLITIECIDELADICGLKPQIAAITACAMRGEIDFRDSLTRRIGLLAGLDVAALQRVYDDRLRLSPGAERMLAGFRRAGAKTLLVSGGFTFFTDRLKARLGFDHAVANTLEIVDGKLTGRISGAIVDGSVKAEEFGRLGSELAGADGLMLAIGDGANDLPMLARANVSIAYHAKPLVRAKATYAIDHCGLDAVLNLLA